MKIFLLHPFAPFRTFETSINSHPYAPTVLPMAVEPSPYSEHVRPILPSGWSPGCRRNAESLICIHLQAFALILMFGIVRPILPPGCPSAPEGTRNPFWKFAPTQLRMTVEPPANSKPPCVTMCNPSPPGCSPGPGSCSHQRLNIIVHTLSHPVRCEWRLKPSSSWVFRAPGKPSMTDKNRNPRPAEEPKGLIVPSPLGTTP